MGSPGLPGPGAALRSSRFILLTAAAILAGEARADDYLLRFDAPSEIGARAGSLLDVPVTVEVALAPGAAPLIGWSLLVDVEGGDLVAVSTAGTAMAREDRDDAGHLDADDFVTKAFVGSANCSSGGDVDYYAIAVLVDRAGGGYDTESQLNATGSPYDLLRLTVRIAVPADAPAECFLRFERGVCDLHGLSPNPPGNGGGATGKDTWVCPLTDPPGGNCLGKGDLEPATITITPRHAPFRRGDANADGKVDIADPIRVFMALFLGEEAPPCESAADANDDGAVDLSDGVKVLTGLFASGLSLPPPGARECGEDPTPDTLPCDAYMPCLE